MAPSSSRRFGKAACNARSVLTYRSWFPAPGSKHGPGRRTVPPPACACIDPGSNPCQHGRPRHAAFRVLQPYKGVPKTSAPICNRTSDFGANCGDEGRRQYSALPERFQALIKIKRRRLDDTFRMVPQVVSVMQPHDNPVESLEDTRARPSARNGQYQRFRRRFRHLRQEHIINISISARARSAVANTSRNHFSSTPLWL